jgi:hypothetical protein
MIIEVDSQPSCGGALQLEQTRLLANGAAAFPPTANPT